MPNSYGCDHESDERYPVVGISDSEGAERRQEEEIETDNAKQRSNDGWRRSPGRRHQQNDDYKCEGNGCRIDVMSKDFQDAGEGGDGE